MKEHFPLEGAVRVDLDLPPELVDEIRRSGGEDGSSSSLSDLVAALTLEGLAARVVTKADEAPRMHARETRLGPPRLEPRATRPEAPRAKDSSRERQAGLVNRELPNAKAGATFGAAGTCGRGLHRRNDPRMMKPEIGYLNEDWATIATGPGSVFNAILDPQRERRRLHAATVRRHLYGRDGDIRRAPATAIPTGAGVLGDAPPGRPRAIVNPDWRWTQPQLAVGIRDPRPRPGS